jgi:hypothetical protein
MLQALIYMFLNKKAFLRFLNLSIVFLNMTAILPFLGPNLGLLSFPYVLNLRY